MRRQHANYGNLSRKDVEVDRGKPFEVFLEKPLGVVLSDLLPRHFTISNSDEKYRVRALCSALLSCTVRTGKKDCVIAS